MSADITVKNPSRQSNPSLTGTFAELAPQLNESFGPRFFPVDQGSKKPIVKWSAITPELFDQWLIDFPDAAIGMVLGDGLAAIDVDLDDDRAAIEAWNAAIDDLGGKAERLVCRSSEATERWLAIIAVDSALKKGVLTFTGHKRKDNGSRAIEFLCEGQYCIVSRTGYRYETTALWGATPNQLCPLSAKELTRLAEAMAEAVTAECGWSVERNAIKGELHGSVLSDGGDGDTDGAHFSVQAGGDLPLSQRRDIVAFSLKPAGMGLADCNREDWLKGLQSAVDLLRDDPDGADHIVACSESSAYPDWDSAATKEVDSAMSRLHREGNVTGAHLLALSIHSEDTTHKAQWLNFERQQQARRSREALEAHKLRLSECSREDELAESKISIKADRVLLSDERERLVSVYRTTFNEVCGEKLSAAQAKKHLALDAVEVGDDRAAIEACSESKSSGWLLTLLDDIENDGFLFRDRHGVAFADVTTLDGQSQTLPVGDGAMRDHLIHVADRRFNKILSTSVAKDMEAMLRLRALHSGNEADVFGRYGRSADGQSQYEFLHDGTGNVIEVNADGVRVAQMDNLDARSVLPRSSEHGVEHRPVKRSELKGLCTKLMTLMRVPKRYWPHALAWLVASRHYGTEYPILYIQAVSGAGKSTMGEFAERLVDPKATRQLKVARKLDGLQAAMAANHVTAQHNISKRYPADLQDLMCVASDGERDSKRRAYSTNEQSVLPVEGPLILTTRFVGMCDAEDVANRTWSIELESIESGTVRLSKDELRQMIDKACIEYTPVLRMLHSEVLRLLPDMPASEGDHLAHSRRVGEAVCRILQLPHSFDEILREEKTTLLQARIDENPFLTALVEYVVRRGGYIESDFVDLLDKLRLDEDQSDADARRESRYSIDKESSRWPATPAEAKHLISTNSDLLRMVGLEAPVKVDGKRTKRGVIYGFRSNEFAPPVDDLKFKLTLCTNPDLPEGPTRSSVVAKGSADNRAEHGSGDQGVFSPLYTQLVERYGNDWEEYAPPEMIEEFYSI